MNHTTTAHHPEEVRRLASPPSASGAGESLKNYPGSKSGSGVTQWLINHMPPHECYIEAFVGSGAVLLMKRPALCSIIIDDDTRVIQAWQRHPLLSDGGPSLLAVPELTIIEGDAISRLPTVAEFHQETTLLYCDPPYLLSTRRSQLKLYRSELMTKLEHLRLLELLLNAKCKVMLSGYHSQLYHSTLRGWRVDTFNTVTHRGQPCTEVVWLNFEDSGELHDYRFVGRGFRERERIRKKINRWARMLLAMPPHERHAIIERVTALRPTSPTPVMPARGPLTIGDDDRSRASSSTARLESHPKKTTHRPAHQKQTRHRATLVALLQTRNELTPETTPPASMRDPTITRGDVAGRKRNQPRRGSSPTRAPHQRSLNKGKP